LGEDLENTHGIPAAHWQLQTAVEGRLKAIVLPLSEEPVWDKDIECWVLYIPELGRIAWNYKFPDHVENFPWQVGDRIFLQEKWCECDYDYYVESITPEAELLGWQPAETMPSEAAQYWYTVTEVRVVKTKDMTILLTGFPSGQSSPKKIIAEWTEDWNAAHPEQTWDGDRWVIVLDVEEIA
jgi:hypothetical protein